MECKTKSKVRLGFGKELMLPALTRRLFSLSIALLLMGASLATYSGQPKPKTHTVSIRDFKFVPQTLTVGVGDTVIWKNEDIVAHTATAKGKSFDSGSIEPGSSWTYVAGKKGTYPYYCAFHPTMIGRLIVR